VSNDVSNRDIVDVVEHLFRHEAGKMIATLTRIFGIDHLTLAEDVVQEALARALKTWPFYGVPKNPAGWILTTSRNLALDTVRRAKVFREKEAEIVLLLDRESWAESPGSSSEGIADDRLRLMFVCCHPVLPPDDQVALTLKTLCGFSPAEIAKAFLTTEAAIQKRLTRARLRIRETKTPFEIPEGEELTSRLEGVLQSLYLLFNEGYKASSGERLVREEISHEAIRLAALLAEHPAGNEPKTHALLAMMLLNAARFPARVDSHGHLLLLQEQDRTRWDQALIARGLFHLTQSAAGNQVSLYHVQAGISALHCAAPDYRSTNWPEILSLYDGWLALDDSPIIALNRAVAVANVDGAAAGLEALDAIPNVRKLDSYYLLYAVRGEFEFELGHFQEAGTHFRKALALALLDSEHQFLANKLHACEKQREARPV
jgi:RNA polymerase sigma-70 factor (ECF subfamily)